MPRFLARVFSVIFHPLFMPLYGIVIIFYSGTFLSIMDKSLMKMIMLFVAATTIGLPLSLITLFVHFKFIKDLQMNERRERILPYITTFIFYAFTQYFVRNFPINYFFTEFLFACTISVLVVIGISLVWKISSHMVGIGGIVGLILALTFEFRTDLMIYLVILLLIAGFLGTARIKLESHTPSQVYSGFILGVINVFGLIWLLY